MRRIFVKVIPNSKKNEITVIDGSFKLHVTAPPQDGKANKACLELIARHFSVKKSAVSIVSGEKSRNKIVEITG